jgi:nuclear pore complex protein Nup205
MFSTLRLSLTKILLDHDTFLPSAVQRYHQLFMPSLQVVNAMLATLGSKHATVSHQVGLHSSANRNVLMTNSLQALDFLSTHSATVVILLKNETDDLSLALLEEIHLLVVLCAKVLPLVPQPEMVRLTYPQCSSVLLISHGQASTHSGFGAINTAILCLCTRFLSGASWIEHIRPQTDEELRNASVLASGQWYTSLVAFGVRCTYTALGFSSSTKFDIHVRQRERLLRKALVAFAGATSNFTGEHGVCLFC